MNRETILYSIINSLTEGVVVVDNQGRPTLVNTAAEHLIGLANLVDFGATIPDTGKSPKTGNACLSLTGRYLAEHELPISRIRRGENVTEFEMRLQRRGVSADLYVSVTGRPLKNTDGVQQGGVIVFRDITAPKLAETRLLDAFESISEGFAVFDADDRLVLCNTRYQEMLSLIADAIVPGASFEDILRAGVARGQYKDAIGREEAWIAKRLREHRNPTGAIEQRLTDGRWLLITECRTREGGIAGLRMDITALKNSEKALRDSEERFQSIAANLPGFIFRLLLKPDGRLEYDYVSPSARLLFGVEPQEMLTDCSLFKRVLHPDDRQVLAEALECSARALSPLQVAYRIKLAGKTQWIRSLARPQRLPNGDVRWDGIGLDVTEQKLTEARLNYLAYHDPLTDLPNRALFEDRLQQITTQAQRGDYALAVHYIDLDYFKDINDTQGHQWGDTVLKAVSERLRNLVRRSDTVARLGGDEFGIIQLDAAHLDQAAVLAQKLIKALSRPFQISEQEEITLSASDGIAVYPKFSDDDTGYLKSIDASELLKRASIALYEAKGAGRNTFRFYNHDMAAPTQVRVTLRRTLYQALTHQEFRLHYQPQIDLDTGHVTGAEALIRWVHPELGLQWPDKFIPLAEESGLIVPIGTWVLQEACAQTRAWQMAGFPPLSLAVNVSATQIRHNDFVETVSQVLEATGIEPHQLELELTESTLILNFEEIIKILEKLKNLGVRLAIDDFGTGYSSFQYLKAFPADKLKIDRIFVRDMVINARDASIVRAIIAVGMSLHLEVVAEGVETPEQWELLYREGCTKGQGYYFSTPLAPGEFTGLLRKGIMFPVSGRRA